MIQSSGTDAISVLIKLVNPKSKLDGTNASAPQYIFVFHDSVGACLENIGFSDSDDCDN